MIVKLNLQSPNLTTDEIRQVVIEARQQQEEGNPTRTPETQRIVRFWEEQRPKMVQRLTAVAPEAPMCLASLLWDQAFQQAKETAGNFPTFNEAMEVAERDNLLMEEEDESPAAESLVSEPALR